jgi:hypothetical protein
MFKLLSYKTLAHQLDRYDTGLTSQAFLAFIHSLFWDLLAFCSLELIFFSKWNTLDTTHLLTDFLLMVF